MNFFCLKLGVFAAIGIVWHVLFVLPFSGRDVALRSLPPILCCLVAQQQLVNCVPQLDMTTFGHPFLLKTCSSSAYRISCVLGVLLNGMMRTPYVNFRLLLIYISNRIFRVCLQDLR
jgi:hypothetical protein